MTAFSLTNEWDSFMKRFSPLRPITGIRERASVAVLIACVGAAIPAGHAQERFSHNAAGYRSLVNRYCLDCHDSAEATAGLQLETQNMGDLAENAAMWEMVITKLRGAMMPPVGEPRPDDETYHAFREWLEGELDTAAERSPNPGRPGLYRLNRTEYATVIRDLLSLDIDVEALLAPDDSVYGFDNVADVLGVSPTLLEGYLAAADRISAIAVGDPEFPPEERRYQVSQRFSQGEHIEGLPYGTRGGIRIEHNFPLDGIYDIDTQFLTNSVDGIRGLQFPHQFEISIDGQRVKLITLGGNADYMQMMENTEASNRTIDARTQLRVRLPAGVHTITATFIEKSGGIDVSQLRPFEMDTFDPVYLGGIPALSSLTIRGPFEGSAPSGDTPSRRAIFTCRPSDADDEIFCAERILSSIAERAYRRPITEADSDQLIEFFQLGRDEKGTFDGGIQTGLRRILASPEFTFRFELDPANASDGEIFEVGDLELASRLSFFLWSSIPDAELIALADANRLSEPDVLEQQVRRMLADPRSTAIVDNFAGQWLQLRNLASIEPDLLAFPDFDDNLRGAFRQETSLFFESIMREDRSVIDLLSADYTFVNERLARHYGMRGVYGSDFRRVQHTDDARRGLLGQGSILTVTSFAHRTSPVVRGAWVLENLLGTPPPDPPDDVPALEETDPESLDAQPLRARLQRHRDNPSCAGCHNIMDPIGFAMENFDGIGRYRARDERGIPIDASGQLASGQPIDGISGLRAALVERPEFFAHTFTEKMLTYAIGRGLEYYDMPTVRKIVRNAADDGYRFSAIVLGIVNSVPFRMKVAERDTELAAAAAQ
jgi:hypothetical protein